MNVLERTIARAYDRFIENTLNKVNGVNKPFKAIQKTEDYKSFESMFVDGFGDQSKWISKNVESLMDSAGITDNLEPLTLEETQRLRGLVSRDLPGLSTFITADKITLDLISFFEWSAVQQYKRWGYLAKDAVQFTLTNARYIAELKDRAGYLLNKSNLDTTTIDHIIDIITVSRLDGMTNGEVAIVLKDTFDEINRTRADMIARTEAANAMGNANYATAKENGSPTHSWVAAGGAEDDICATNVDDGEIPINQPFSSGDLSEPAHPNCECYTEAGEIDLDSIQLWTGA